MISESILRIIDYNTADSDEKTLVVSVLQLNEGEKLHQLLALMSCSEGMKQFCERNTASSLTMSSSQDYFMPSSEKSWTLTIERPRNTHKEC